MQFEVQSASVTNHFTAQIASPDCCCGSSTIRARQILLALTLLIIAGTLWADVVVVRALCSYLITTGP